MIWVRVASHFWTIRPIRTGSSSCPQKMEPTMSWSPASWIFPSPAKPQWRRLLINSPTCWTARPSSSLYDNVSALTHSQTHTSTLQITFGYLASVFWPKAVCISQFFLWQSDIICLPGGSSHQLRLIPWTKSFDHWASTTKILHSTSNPVFNLRSCLITPCQ